MLSDSSLALKNENREIMKNNSKSFSFAAAVFEREPAEAAQALYRWCRVCDDEIDLPPSLDEARRALTQLYANLDAIERGESVASPAFQSLALVLNKFSIPHRYPADLLAGFALDLDFKTPTHFGDLERY